MRLDASTSVPASTGAPLVSTERQHACADLPAALFLVPRCASASAAAHGSAARRAAADRAKARMRSGRRHQAELTEQLDLIEVRCSEASSSPRTSWLDIQRTSTCRPVAWDLAFGRAHDAGVRANRPALGRPRWILRRAGGKSQDAHPEMRPRTRRGAQNLLAAVHGRVRCNELGGFAPRIGVRIPGVERLDARSTTCFRSAIRLYLLFDAVREYSPRLDALSTTSDERRQEFRYSHVRSAGLTGGPRPVA
jgi:hypothetical protein